LQTLELLPLYAKVQPLDAALLFEPPALEDDDDVLDPFVILSETKVLDLSTRFRRDADAYYVEAERSTVMSIAQIPYWMYGVLVVLGWNEAMAVLFNPVYFAFMLVLAASG
jgi:protein SEY1